MSTIVTIQSSDVIANSRADINTNFANLNTDKVEGTGAASDSQLAVFGASNKQIKGATGTGFVKETAGIVSTVSSIVETDLGLTDVGTGNATSSKHGFLPKTSADSTKFLNGGTAPAFANVKDSDLSLSDITTNDASTGRHGFVPKLGGATGKFYRNDGTYASPGAATYLGAWTSVTLDTATQAATGGFVVGFSVHAGGAPTCDVYSDAANPPTTRRAGVAGGALTGSFCVPVVKGDYYKVTTGGGATVTAFFIPIGT